MGHDLNGTRVLNYFDLDTFDIGGDSCRVEIVLSYDLDAKFYVVERFNDNKSWHHEEFDTQFAASVCFKIWVNRANKDNAKNRADANLS